MRISVYFETSCFKTRAFTLNDSTRNTVFNAKWLFIVIQGHSVSMSMKSHWETTYSNIISFVSHSHWPTTARIFHILKINRMRMILFSSLFIGRSSHNYTVGQKKKLVILLYKTNLRVKQSRVLSTQAAAAAASLSFPLFSSF